MITISFYQLLSILLFAIGLYGVLAKRNAIAILMAIDIMLNAVNINLVTFTRYITPGELIGQLFAIFVIVVAAAEVAVGIALVIAIYRLRGSVHVDGFNWLKW